MKTSSKTPNPRKADKVRSSIPTKKAKSSPVITESLVAQLSVDAFNRLPYRRVIE